MSRVLIGLMICSWPVVSGLFEWLRRTHPEPVPPPQYPPVSPVALAKNAQFEMTTTDEKFLAEVKEIELSPLDSCHYKVVSRLKSSCDRLSEEQLAKLGVTLLNCQAEVEGRRTYPCTDEMTIKECTTDMDSDTWNAYHIVSNRALSVCYAARQQLFRRRAEHTVNTLISTAASQLDAMKELKEGQLELRELTADSMNKLLAGHSALQTQQGKLFEGQELMDSSLKANLEHLGQEKALIASGQQLVGELIQDITKKMENVSEHLQSHSSEVQDSHSAIVKDLADVRHQAQDIYQRIDHSMSEFLQYQDQTTQYYADLMRKLERMNNTLGVALRYLDNMQSRIEERLHVIQAWLGSAGLSLAAMWTCLLHTGYFVMCAILLTFLHCPGFSRAALLLAVPLNAAAEVNQQPALDLSSLTLLLLTLTLGHWVVTQLWTCLQISPKLAVLLPPPCEIVAPEKLPVVSSTPRREEEDGCRESSELLDHDSFISGDVEPLLGPRFIPTISKPDHSTPWTALLDETPPRNPRGATDWCDVWNDSRSASPSLSVLSNRSASGRQLCSAVTKIGKPCKKRATAGQEYCRVHEGGHTSYMD
ncbi:protein brambleberry [Thalassophryne amazonica]|uniref:protein brambleberry n=1 Tax=Thalassophryne amazonica TaxID=390379 RepID=UPI001471B3DE|nr:protein brambleberry [Thalassophryne amazonica]